MILRNVLCQICLPGYLLSIGSCWISRNTCLTSTSGYLSGGYLMYIVFLYYSFHNQKRKLFVYYDYINSFLGHDRVFSASQIFRLLQEMTQD